MTKQGNLYLSKTIRLFLVYLLYQELPYHD